MRAVPCRAQMIINMPTQKPGQDSHKYLNHLRVLTKVRAKCESLVSPPLKLGPCLTPDRAFPSRLPVYTRVRRAFPGSFFATGLVVRSSQLTHKSPQKDLLDVCHGLIEC